MPTPWRVCQHTFKRLMGKPQQSNQCANGPFGLASLVRNRNGTARLVPPFNLVCVLPAKKLMILDDAPLSLTRITVTSANCNARRLRSSKEECSRIDRLAAMLANLNAIGGLSKLFRIQKVTWACSTADYGQVLAQNLRRRNAVSSLSEASHIDSKRFFLGSNSVSQTASRDFAATQAPLILVKMPQKKAPAVRRFP